jgi:hypothetical protein
LPLFGGRTENLPAQGFSTATRAPFEGLKAVTLEWWQLRF